MSASSPTTARFRFLDFVTIVREPLPQVAYAVEPLIVIGTRVVIYAPWGAMKTWLALDLGIHLAAGIPWLGKFPIPEPRRVLYIDEEMNVVELRRRLKRLAIGAELDSENVPFKALSRSYLRFGNDARPLISALEEEKFDPDIIILDSLRRVLVGSENEAEAVSEFWRNVEPLLKGGQRTLIVIHHMKKPNPERPTPTRDRASGSTDILAGPDTAFAITRTAQDAVRVECVKSRHGEEAAPFIVSLYAESEDGPVVMRYEGSAADFKGVTNQQVRAATLAEEFLAAAPDRTAETGAVEAYVRGKGIAARTAERALPTLREWGRVTRLQRGRWQLVDWPNA